MRGRTAGSGKNAEQRSAFSVGILVLAGGAGSRMGREKSTLSLDGKTFLSVITEQFQDFLERLLSVGEKELLDCHGFHPVFDRYPGCGPIGGIHAGLLACRSAYLLVLGCDMPFYPAALARYLSLLLEEGVDVLIPVDGGGRSHPLGGIYAKSVAPVLEQQIREGDYRLQSVLKKLSVKRIPLDTSGYSDQALSNINTPEDYAAMCGGKSL